MKPGAHLVLVSAARLYAPIAALFALALLATRAPGYGVGAIAGLAFGLALVLHALVFGAAALQRALPPLLLRVLLAAGLVAAVSGAGLPGWRLAAQAVEAGAALATASATGLIVLALFGRAPTLQDSDW